MLPLTTHDSRVRSRREVVIIYPDPAIGVPPWLWKPGIVGFGSANTQPLTINHYIYIHIYRQYITINNHPLTISNESLTIIIIYIYIGNKAIVNHPQFYHKLVVINHHQKLVGLCKYDFTNIHHQQSTINHEPLITSRCTFIHQYVTII